MITRLSHITVVLIAMVMLLGSAARADLISIDFNRRDASYLPHTATNTMTDVNGDTSLPGQTGYWNQLLTGVVGGGLSQPAAANTVTTGLLNNGNGDATSVSFTFNTNNVSYLTYDQASTTILNGDWVGVQPEEAPADWVLSGLEPNTVYRLRMFGREAGGESVSWAAFTATGTASDSGFCISTRNYVDLWVNSTAEGEILGTLENITTGFAAWSGMQIESMPSVISMDFNLADTTYGPGVTASGTVADLNGDLSFPGQVGTWNAVLMGKDAGEPNYNITNNEVKVVGLLDGGGDATTVSFDFNITKVTYASYGNPYVSPYLTELHRDSIYSADPMFWQIDGLQPSTEYTLKFFGFQQTASPYTRLFATFSATGINTANGTTVVSQNYVDLVVTSTVRGVITGTKSGSNGAWTGIQIQSSEPFPQPNPNLISIDFDLPTTLPTQSGLNIDTNGQTSLPGQSGTWNSLSMPGTGSYNTGITATLTSGTLKNGAGVDTSVSFAFNTGNIDTWNAYKTSTTPGVQRDFLGCFGTTFPEWTLTNLEANTLYRLRMFGREDSNVPVGFATFRAAGTTTNVASTYAKRNQADLWVTSTAGGTISGTLGGYWPSAGAWSGMQIERVVEMPAAPPVISIDFGYADGTVWPGPVASYQQVDMNGDISLPGQNGPWNELLTGSGATGTSNNGTNDTPVIAGLLDGDGNATAVAFTFNNGGITYTTFAGNPAEPKLTSLHRDAVYVAAADWSIAGLTPSTEYTLKFFGLQTSGPVHPGAFTATGLNTASGSASLLTSYVDLVVTSTVSGDIMGTLAKTTTTVGSFSGIQIQASGSGEPFPTHSNLISLDFETADTGSKTATASGTITDSNGDSSWGQVGVWNSLESGATDGGAWQGTTMQPSINNMFDGLGNTTTVDFQYNTGTPVEYNVYSIAGALLGDMFVLLGATDADVSWQLTGLQPYAYYTMRMFGQVASNPSAWEAYGAGGNTDSDTNSSTMNYVDLTVPANGAGVITGKHIFTGAGGAGGASWSGMQILKLADDPFVPAGTLFMVK